MYVKNKCNIPADTANEGICKIESAILIFMKKKLIIQKT